MLRVCLAIRRVMNGGPIIFECFLFLYIPLLSTNMLALVSNIVFAPDHIYSFP
jgi:hypothetical protein